MDVYQREIKTFQRVLSGQRTHRDKKFEQEYKVLLNYDPNYKMYSHCLHTEIND
jgi:hypothetical protein